MLQIYDRMSFDASIFILDRGLVLDGQLWRLLTCHLYHINSTHLIYNLLGLALVLSINCRLWQSAQGAGIVLALSLWVSVALLFNNPEILYYGGLSGILHGMFVIAVVTQHELPRLWRILLSVGVIAKVAMEQSGISGLSSLNDDSVRVAIDAHLYGLVGALVGLAVYGVRHTIVQKMLAIKKLWPQKHHNRE